jgi:hypothetical protein
MIEMKEATPESAVLLTTIVVTSFFVMTQLDSITPSANG